MAAGLRLRAGTAADVRAFYELDLLCFDGPFQFSLRTMREFALLAGALVVVAETDEAGVAGFVIVHLESDESARVRGYVVTLDVHPKHRRQGIARGLLAEVERQSAESGATAMALHVYTGNADALGLYGRAGYGFRSVAPEFYGDGLDGWELGKGL